MSVISPKAFHVGCSKVCKSKGGLTLHTRAKHGEKTAVAKSVSPLTSKVVCEIVDKATKSVVDLKFMANQCLNFVTKPIKAVGRPSETFINFIRPIL